MSKKAKAAGGQPAARARRLGLDANSAPIVSHSSKRCNPYRAIDALLIQAQRQRKRHPHDWRHAAILDAMLDLRGRKGRRYGR
ncbi:MAG: hypothetical protein ACOYZ7_20420 [Chloroflexota bacterium]